MSRTRNLALASGVGTVLALTLLLVVAAAADPDPPSWTAFQSASFSDMYLTPSLTTGWLSYTLSLGLDPKMTIDSVTYDIAWVKAYFVVSQDQTTGFTATNNGTDPLDWKWEVNTAQGKVAGWHNGNDNLLPDKSVNLLFGSLDITNNAVLSGLHVGYNSTTAWFKGDLPEIPEPCALLALACASLAALASMRKKRP